LLALKPPLDGLELFAFPSYFPWLMPPTKLAAKLACDRLLISRFTSAGIARNTASFAHRIQHLL
jgi:hypothetical protein